MTSQGTNAPAKPRVVVVGAGAIGLAAAIRLRERGHDVEVWGKDEPADTVSAVAAAIWYPFLAEPRERVLGWAAATFRQLAALANEPHSGVCMSEVVEELAADAGPPWWAGAASTIEHLRAADVPTPHGAAIRLQVPVCDTRVHFPWLRQRLQALGGRLVRRHLQSLDEAFAAAPVVVHCSGLGAASLCGDRDVHPVRGQVVCVRRPPGLQLPALIDDTEAQPFYVIPRGDQIVLGGTAQANDDNLAVDARDTQSILAGVEARVPALRSAAIEVVKVGLRPCRSQVRLERERRADGGVLVHDYGHGGSGYTLSWGCADEVVALVAAALAETPAG
ncbi:MAG: FAD-dependent oxidoreductase [Planctomycetota bacterium]|jgi:D-amino-acid oxidase